MARVKSGERLSNGAGVKQAPEPLSTDIQSLTTRARKRRASQEARVRVATATHVGHGQHDQEDAVRANAKAGYLVLADGMGGAGAGELASAYIVDFLSEKMADVADASPETDEPTGVEPVPESRQAMFGIRQLGAWIEQASEQLTRIGKVRPHCLGMASTVAALWVSGDNAAIAHVGDSRVYRLRGTQLKRLTIDHSVGDSQLTTLPSVAKNRPRAARLRGLLTLALGCEQSITPGLELHSMCEGDTYLLCTDGLTDFVAERQIGRLMRDFVDYPEQMVEALVAAALAANCMDNVTVAIYQAVNVVTQADSDGTIDPSRESRTPRRRSNGC